ncbi:MAG: cell division protein FtsI, partial [Actinobacteria bacterium]|nr:cell division protein FtsI [Actinomycetota bacterium]
MNLRRALPRRASSDRRRSAAAARTRQRLWAMVAVFGLMALLPLVKLVGVQFADASEIAAKGLEQRQRTETIPALRGSILDRNGVELAVSVPATTVAVNRVVLARAAITE